MIQTSSVVASPCDHDSVKFNIVIVHTQNPLSLNVSIVENSFIFYDVDANLFIFYNSTINCFASVTPMIIIKITIIGPISTTFAVSVQYSVQECWL